MLKRMQELMQEVEKAISSNDKKEILSTYQRLDAIYLEYENIPGEDAINIRENLQGAKLRLALANIKLDLILQS